MSTELRARILFTSTSVENKVIRDKLRGLDSTVQITYAMYSFFQPIEPVSVAEYPDYSTARAKYLELIDKHNIFQFTSLPCDCTSIHGIMFQTYRYNTDTEETESMEEIETELNTKEATEILYRFNLLPVNEDPCRLEYPILLEAALLYGDIHPEYNAPIAMNMIRHRWFDRDENDNLYVQIREDTRLYKEDGFWVQKKGDWIE